MGKIAFVFAGQGAQYPGMMRDLAESAGEARQVFEAADHILGRSVSALCFEGSESELGLTENTQPCVLAADIAAYAAVTGRGILPDMAAGFSLGEYAALVAAGVLTAKDAFLIVQLRAGAMQRAVPAGRGGMVSALRLDEKQLGEVLTEVTSGFLAAANYNCPGQVVLSGETAAIAEAATLIKAKGGMAVTLPVSAPFHCEMMSPAAEELAEAIGKTELSDARLPLYMNVDGAPERTAALIREKLILQAKCPVQWEKTVRNMAVAGADTFVELGPGKTLSGLIRRTLGKDAAVFRVENQKTLDETCAAILK